MHWIHSFKGRMTLVFGLSFALATVLFLCQIEQSESKNIEQVRREAQQVFANNVADTFALSLEERAREIRLLSRSELFVNGDLSSSRIQSRLEDLKNNYDFYSWIGVADTNGLVTAATKGMLKGEQVGQRPWFMRGQKTHYLGDVHEAVLLSKLVENPHPQEPLRFIDFASPIYAPDGRLRGVLGSHADWAWANSVIEKALAQSRGLEHSEVFIVSTGAERAILYPYAAIGKVQIPAAVTHAAFSAITRWGNASYLVSSTGIQSASTSHLGWQVIVREPEAVALRQVRDLRQQMLGYAGVLILVFSVLAYFLSRWISRPIEQLTWVAREVTTGEENIHFLPKSKVTEIQALSTSLQDMLSQLKLRQAQNLAQQEQLMLSTEQLELAFQSAHMGAYHWDIPSGEVTWSDAYRQLFKTPEEMPGSFENFRNSVHVDDWEATQSQLLHCLSEGQDFEAEFRIHWPDGTVRWILSRGAFFRNSDGQVNRMEGVATDVTERKQVELELAEYRSHLEQMVEDRTAQQRLLERELQAALDDQNAILSSDIVGFWITKNRTVTWLNSIAAHDLGYVPEELIGQSTRNCYSGQQSYEMFGEARQQAIATQQLFHTQWQWKHKDGHLRWFDITAAPMPSDPESTIWAAINIDALKRTERDLRHAKVAADSANQAKSQFLANMSHEIRTPLNAIIGMSYLLKDTPLNQEQHEEVNAIHASSQSLLALINDILDISKIEAGELQLETIRFSLPQLCQELLQMYGSLMAGKGLAFALTLDDQLPVFIQGDRNRLRQMLTNFIGNAMKFTERGRIDLIVREARRDVANKQVWLKFSVTDTGIGIDAQAQQQLFAPFKQADAGTTRRFGGTGLGLSIVKQLALKMGGTVGLESEAGKGSTFWMELPFAFSEALSDDAELESTSSGDGAQAVIPSLALLKGARILVVDDSYTNLDVCYRLLSTKGAKPTLCESGAQALNTLRLNSSGIDLVLMDVQMPGMSGLEATQAIRQELKITHIPVIALSAGATPEEIQQAMASGMNDFLTKPIDPDQLFSKLASHLQALRATGQVIPQNPWPIIAGIDAEVAQQLTAGDVAQFRQLLQAFLHGHEGCVARINEALAHQDFERAIEMLSLLKFQAQRVGATHLHDCCVALLRVIQSKKVHVAAELGAFAEAASDFFDAANAVTPSILN